jgi:hypothetical protein
MSSTPIADHALLSDSPLRLVGDDDDFPRSNL